MKLQFRNETQILLEMIDDANQKGLFQTSSETMEKLKQGLLTANQYILNTSVEARLNAELEHENEINYNNINLQTASGGALDNFGNLHNVPRITAGPAIVEIIISIPTASNEDIVIPQGTRLLIEGAAGVGDYITSDEIILSAGVESVTGRAESIDYGYQNELLIGNVVGIDGFPLLNATNTTDGTHGRNIEEDDDYRLRIMDWSTINERGTEDCIRSYLEGYDGLDGYALIPLYDGVGTLKIICDTIQSELDNISQGVKQHCLDYLDELPVCELPTDLSLSSLTLDVDLSGQTSGYSLDELTQLTKKQINTFVEGGTNRNGDKVKGMNIGDNFIPSQLIKYLLDNIEEISNIVLSETDIIIVDPHSKFKIETITVNYNETI